MILIVMLGVGTALLSVLAAVGLYQWIRLQQLRRRASITDLTAWVGTLLRSFAPGSVLIAEPNGKDGFLQFALTHRNQEWRTLEFGLPETDWSLAAMAEIQVLLDSEGISWKIEVAQPEQTIRCFLRAEFDGERAHVLQRVSSLVPRIAAAMGHSELQTYQVRLLGHDDPEYQHELAKKLENLPNGGRVEKKLAKVVRGRINRYE